MTRLFSLLRPAFSWHPPLNVTHYYSCTEDQGEWRCAVVHVQSLKKGSQTRERLADRGALNISRKWRGKKQDEKRTKNVSKDTEGCWKNKQQGEEIDCCVQQVTAAGPLTLSSSLLSFTSINQSSVTLQNVRLLLPATLSINNRTSLS